MMIAVVASMNIKNRQFDNVGEAAMKRINTM